MKNLVRKSMFVLSFLGLFTFVAPKQAKAIPTPDIGAPDFCMDFTCSNGFNGTLCGPSEVAVLLKIMEICGVSVYECER